MMKWLQKWRRPDHRWPKYLPGGRFRTSTLAMVIAFAALAWLYQAYEPPAPDPIPETAVVPPGFVPDPNYTWVPRTNVRTGESQTSTTTTTPTSPTESTSPGETTTPSSPSESTPTTGESGSSKPQTSPEAPSTKPTPAADPETPTTAPQR